jgi:hypothetical protein
MVMSHVLSADVHVLSTVLSADVHVLSHGHDSRAQCWRSCAQSWS